MGASETRPVLFIVPAVVVLVLLLVLPLGVIVASSLTSYSQPGVWTLDPTLANYAQVFEDTFYLEVLARTVGLSLCVTLASLVLGYVLAVHLWLVSDRSRVYLMMIVLAPLLVSVVARTYGWLLVLGERGLVNSMLLHAGLITKPLSLLYNDAAVVLGLTHLLIPFAVLSIHASLERIDWEIIEAALVAGAGYATILTRILIPLSVPGLTVGGTLVFSLAMSAYVTPALMGGNQSALATLIAQKYLVAFDWNFGASLSVILLLAGLAGVLLITALIGAPFRRRSEARVVERRTLLRSCA